MLNKGFTILEVVLAIFILTVAVFASFSLVEQTITAASLNQSRLVAYYLAQEGVENVKNIRDENWLNYRSWDQGMETGEETVDRFTRETSIVERKDEDNNDYLEVKVIVQWSERGRDHKVEVINYLYNWYGI